MLSICKYGGIYFVNTLEITRSFWQIETYSHSSMPLAAIYYKNIMAINYVAIRDELFLLSDSSQPSVQ